ncbi:hypothetical protein HDU67_003756 [Dinochytrium kinnereticum]|nr:hypothetical protein HDU67_003756 [Dinochytrium kinnereticum]
MLPIAAIVCLSAAALAAAAPSPEAASSLAKRADGTLPKFFVPSTSFEEVNAGVDSIPASFAPAALSPEDIAKSYIASKTSGSVANIKITSVVTDPSNGVTMVHLVETRDGIEVANLVSNVNIDASGTILSAGHASASTAKIRPVRAGIFARSASYSASDAVVAAAEALGHPTAGLASRLRVRDGVVTGAGDLSARDIVTAVKYFVKSDGSLVKVNEVQVEQDQFWGNMYVTVDTNEVIAATNWISDSKFDFDVLPEVEPVEIDEEDYPVDDEEDYYPEEDDIEMIDDEEDPEDADIVNDTFPRTSKVRTTRVHIPRTTRVRTTRVRTTRIRTPRVRTTRVRTTRVRTTRVRTTRVRTTRVRTTRPHKTHTVRPKTTKTTSSVFTATAVPTTLTSTATTSTTVVFPTSTTSFFSTSSTTTTEVPTTTTFVVPTSTSTSTSTSTPTSTSTTTSTATVSTTTATPVPTSTTSTIIVPPTLTTTTAVGTTTSRGIPTPTFLVVPYTEESIVTGQQTFVDPALRDASPNGWFARVEANTELVTIGNNVRATRGGVLGTSQNGGSFEYPFDQTVDPTTPGNIASATANVFYAVNMYHDLLYRFGFTEKFSNFQTDNFDKGGSGNDAVLAFVQASDGLNNANFATPPDGTAGRMRMYLWDRSTPRRDGDVDNGVIIHELTHGLSNRLTGGTGNGNCLQTLEARGMGEGWSDILAWWATMKPSDTRASNRVLGSYVFNNPIGIRRFPYSTDMTTNPNTYAQLATLSRVHDIGDTWSSIIYEVYWNMVESGGFNADLYDATSTAGNTRFLKNIVDGLKLQPCNPTFITARNAIIQADKVNNGGKFVCDMWRGFAKRGLGAGANATKVDNFDLGDGCV